MDEARLREALVPLVSTALASDLATNFLEIRHDYATKTLERASPGKFVEAFVQCLQHIATGSHDAKPNVDDYLSKRVESEATLSEGLRICGARIARSVYTLRNKRNIAHKNQVDPNTFDLAFAHQGAAWIMAELVRTATGLTMQEAGELIELLQAPVGSLVEEIDGIRLIHADLSIRGEVLVLLHSHYPQAIPLSSVLRSMNARSAGSVRNGLNEMRIEKLVHGDARSGYRLTQAGHRAAVAEIKALAV
jgi:hypothetical protein